MKILASSNQQPHIQAPTNPVWPQTDQLVNS